MREGREEGEVRVLGFERPVGEATNVRHWSSIIFFVTHPSGVR